MKKIHNKRLPKLAVTLIFCLLCWFTATAQNTERKFTVSGKLTDDSTKDPLPGAFILVSGQAASAVSDEAGLYSLSLPKGNYELTVSFVGFKSIQQDIELEADLKMDFALIPEDFSLSEVEVVSTGYQEIPKERVTGSFVQLDQDLVNRRVSTSILDRIEDVSSGVIFNRTTGGSDPINIRGRATLFGNTTPLIVIDNLPYEGSLESINPNDVESITILKDAAAASIWGARAGNGVIVITTKSGKFDQPLRFSFQANTNLIEKPDLFYAPQMEINDFIAQERSLFDAGYYNSMITSIARPPLSPVVETLLQVREGTLSAAEGDRMLSELGRYDSRRELLNYYYRPAVNQQYAFQASGGGAAHHFNFSGGFDRNAASVIGNEEDRVTLNARQTWKLLGQKLQISTGIYLSRGRSIQTTELPNPRPYERLADESGNPLPIVASLSNRFVESTADTDLLDWRYIPLNEIGKRNQRSTSLDFRGNLDLVYQILPGLQAEARYQYWTNQLEQRNLESPELYEIRDQINRYTQVGEDGTLSFPIPRGERFTSGHSNSISHNLRTNLRYHLKNKDHEWNALAGWELRDLTILSDEMQYFGYDDQRGLSMPVDYFTRFPQFQNPGLSLTIPYGGEHSGITDRYISYFGNLGYSFKNKYLLTASARKDLSNLFGVETNQRGVPLWSAGAGWIISEEAFYNWSKLPYLKLRLTYGFNGNADKNTTAFTTVNYSNNHPYIPGYRYAFISNPPNPTLRWERIGIWNMALDFESKSGRVSGSLEFYNKNGNDLIGETEVPDSNGIYQYRGNFSSTQTRGFDITLTTQNLKSSLDWSTQFLISGWKDEVTEFEGARSAIQYFGSNATNVIPLEGRPLFSIYSLPWAGLDPTNGNPLGFFNEEPSDNYLGILTSATPESIRFHGSARPTLFGSVRNNLAWKGFSLSMNITFRLGYYFRRSSVDYTALSRGQVTHSDYSLRWQNPGDELTTQVPSQPPVFNSLRHTFYQVSSVLVERGDHVRLQDIRLGYSWSRSTSPSLPVEGMELYAYFNNLGLIWKATDQPIDPDFPTLKPQRSAAIGLRIDF
ncbi:SusC/RagA family TonB-linked outer membrane protein [Algoriphagus sp.]|uniref:SusC/RagA family TonB-linked outer membrane protein n=1 Tax=Algoriphagus sp. TaxID=1872435 RepID=UPI00262F3778|nr:SusC/RagA family TonB-linked outer membrane protein [Algoriphagus sp.]